MYPGEPDVAMFTTQMQTLATDFRVLALAEALRQQADGSLPVGAVAVTFDDGFADNVTVALPVLRRLGVPATFFIASGFLGDGYMFNNAVIEACRQAPEGSWPTGTVEFGVVPMGRAVSRVEVTEYMIAKMKYLEASRRRDLAYQLLESASARMPQGLMMSHEQLRELHGAGMTIGGHTRSHPILNGLGDRAAEEEIAGGRADLEGIIGAPVSLFAYPNGRPGKDYGPRDVALVRSLGFQAAVTTAWGYSDKRTDPCQVPRVGSWDRTAWRFSARLVVARALARGSVCGVTPQQA